jgi:hypothetical protein
LPKINFYKTIDSACGIMLKPYTSYKERDEEGGNKKAVKNKTLAVWQ